MRFGIWSRSSGVSNESVYADNGSIDWDAIEKGTMDDIFAMDDDCLVFFHIWDSDTMSRVGAVASGPSRVRTLLTERRTGRAG